MRKLLTENSSEVLRILLRRLDVKFTSHTIKAHKNHPGFPNLLSFSYILSRIGVENVAIRSTYEELQSELPKPLLVHLLSNGGMYLVVETVNQTGVQFINEGNNLESQSKEEFINLWSGIVLIPYNEKKAKEANYSRNLILDLIEKIRLPFFILSIILAVCSILLIQMPNLNIYHGLFFVSKIIGLFVSVLLIIQVIDRNNALIKRICSSTKSKSSCTNVLDSQGAFILGVISWSEIGLVYFATGFLFNLVLSESLFITALMGLTSVSFVPYSIYYQLKIVKSWCKLCLIIQGVLLIESFIGLAFVYQEVQSITIAPVVGLISITLVSTSLYSLLKPILFKWNSYSSEIPKLNRIKLDREVFITQLSRSRLFDITVVVPLRFGNIDSENKLTIISNPLCAPCNEIHKNLLNLMRRKPDLLVNEIFLIDKDDLFSYRIALVMYALKRKVDDPYELINILSDYYFGRVTPQQWLSKYEGNDINLGQAELDSQIEWCIRMGFYTTPILLFNGRSMPEGYAIEDLEYLID